MSESEITREMIEGHLGCRFEWLVNGRHPRSRVFARLWPLPGGVSSLRRPELVEGSSAGSSLSRPCRSLEEMMAYWNEHGWRFAHDYEDPTSESGAFIEGHAGQYSTIYADKRRTHLFLPFWAHRSHYVCQHWWDPLPHKLWRPIYANLRKLEHIPLIDISLKDEGLSACDAQAGVIFTATMRQVFDHFMHGTNGDMNLPILKVVDVWRKARGGV